ncbi:MAG: 3-deoxy-8-phosphooctulonate synthase [Nitrospirota bacterium]
MKKLKIIAGNCILEDFDTTIKTAEALIDFSKKYNFDLVYKSSFKKDNRSSQDYYTGLNLSESIKIFKYLKQKYNVDILTDFHNLYELDTEIVDVIDILQIPAYLCMQTELVLKIAHVGKPVNIKKGQFLHPEDVGKIVKKIESTGNKNIMVTERGTCFGYRDLVVDPRSFYILKKFGYPVFFDAGHAVRKYGVPSADIAKGGTKEYINILACAAIACKIDGIFVEVHPEPDIAKCDAATQFSFKEFEKLLKEVLPIWDVVNKNFNREK